MFSKISSHYTRIASSILIGLILLMGLLLRSEPYLAGDFNYFLDQSRDLLLTQDIVENRDITLIGARSGISGIFHGPLWLYIMVPFYIAASGDPFWTLIPLFLIVNLLPVLLAYIAGTYLFRRSIGLLWALFLATSLPFVQTSFNTSNAQVMPALFLAFITLAVAHLQGRIRPIVTFPLLSALIGLSFHFESAFAVFLIPLSIILLLLQPGSLNLKVTVLSIISGALAVSNFILFEIKNRFLMTQGALKLLGGKMESTYLQEFDAHADVGMRVLFRLQGLAEYYIYPLFSRDEAIVVLFVGGLILGAYNTMRSIPASKKKKRTIERDILFVVIIPVLYFTLYILYPYPLWPHYTIALVVPSGLFSAIIVSRLFHASRRWRVVGIAMTLAVVVPVASWIFNVYILGNTTGQHRTYLAQYAVAASIFEDAQGAQEIGYYVYDAGLLTYNFDYLMGFLGKKYGVTTQNAKPTFFYVILTPAPKWDAGAHAWWLEHVVRTTGEVVQKQQFSGDISVLKMKAGKNEEPHDPNYSQNLIFR